MATLQTQLEMAHVGARPHGPGAALAMVEHAGWDTKAVDMQPDVVCLELVACPSQGAKLWRATRGRQRPPSPLASACQKSARRHWLFLAFPSQRSGSMHVTLSGKVLQDQQGLQA